MNLPNDETGNTLKGLFKDGSDLTKPMEIDFFIAVPNAEIGELIVKALDIDSSQFKCSVEQDDETKDWTCYVTQTLIPSYENVTKTEKYLANVADQYEDSYLDGFGSYGNV